MARPYVRAAVLTALILGLSSTTSVTDIEEAGVRFTAAGDFSSSTAGLAVLSQIRTSGNDLTIALGDLSYGVTGTEQSWCDLVTSRVGPGYPFELIAGNHESNGQNGNINDFSACLPNQLPGAVGTYGRQYYVDVPAEAPLVRYILVSPGIQFPDGIWSYNAGTPGYAWTASTIDAARAARIPWVVVAMHKPCLSVGEYGCEPGADIMNLLVAKKVDLVLSGHEHHYARTRQLATAPGCPTLVPNTFNATCVVDSDDTLAKGAGTVFATVGTGGVGLRSIHTSDPEFPYFAATSGSDREPAHGFLQVSVVNDTLEGEFTAVSTSTFSDAFSITGDNLPPTATFTTSTTGLTVSVNGSGSQDPDGSVLSYSFDFGDGQSSTEPVTSHTYATPGNYQVTLTVADDQGATTTAVRTVAVADPAGPTPVATDTFERNLAGQWGAADLGGMWVLSSASANFTVSGGSGFMRMPAPGSAPGAYLGSLLRTDTEVRVDVGQDKPPTGMGTSVRVQPRRLGNGDGYFTAVRFVPDGSVVVTLVRLVGTQTKLATLTVPGLTHAASDIFHVRAQVSGVSPTTLRAKVWKVGTTEPSSWLASATDATATLQFAGSVGLRAELGSNSTNAPVRASFDNLWVGPTS